MGASQFFTNHLLPHTEAYTAQLVSASIANSKPYPSGQYVGYVNALIAGLIIDNYWYELDRMWIFAAEQRVHAQLSIVNPSGLNASWPVALSEQTNGGTLTWNAGQGYTNYHSGAITPAYLDLMWKPSDGPNFYDNSAAIGVYSYSDINLAGTWDVGAADATNIASLTCGNGFNKGGYLNNDSTHLYLYSNSNHHTGSLTTLTRYSNVNVHYEGGLVGYGTASASPARPTVNAYALTYNLNGTPAHSTTTPPPGLIMNAGRLLSMVFFGAGALDQTAFYNTFQAFATAIGFNQYYP
ncbi:MAG TPA: hypothetical protein VNY36_02405 [Bacteroidia bacterium]|jgi:hypothetical protein|nr:hypothetical protein [Bacteroidia bacterium]